MEAREFISLDDGESELIVLRSKFLAKIFHVKDESRAKEIIERFKKQYFDASHVCYAYIIDDNTWAFSDDNEPSGTAGSAIYKILSGQEYKMTLAIVIRYFGGTKLGVGGLKRAYSESALLAIKKCKKLSYILSNIYQFSTDFSTFNKLSKQLNESVKILKTEFSDNVLVECAVPISLNFYSLLSNHEIKPKLLQSTFVLR